uniref:HPP family n=1 Tax=Desulfovibrio sp. U5L TaxID=596152 RepID=I2PYG4_9BACT
MTYSKMECLTMLLVVCMVALGEYADIRDIIFPEIAALAFGAWVMEERPWPGAAWTLWLSPTLGAATGVLLLRAAPFSIVALVGIAFAFVLLELKLFRSAMSPSFSAAILPIIAHIDSWTYPAAVCVMTAAIALVSHAGDRKKARTGDVSLRPAGRPAHASLAREWRHYGKLLFFILLVALFSTTWGGLYMMAPPLIVAFVELAHPEGALRQKSMPRLLLLLSACALAGTAWMAVVVRLFSGPLWLAAGLSVATAFAVARRLNLSSPPALALALLPTILPEPVLYLYPLHILVGSAIFIVLGQVWFKPAAAA